MREGSRGAEKRRGRDLLIFLFLVFSAALCVSAHSAFSFWIPYGKNPEKKPDGE